MTQRINPIGVNVHLEQSSNATIDAQLDLAQAAGCHWIRVEFIWALTAPTNVTTNFTTYDYIVSGVRSRGMEVLALLSQYNTAIWSRGGAPWNQPPTPSDYAGFAVSVVSHYGSQITYYEIGNEPNQSLFWYPSVNAAAYTALLQAAYTAIKAANSSAQIISAGTSPASPDTYLTAMYAAGARGYMDYIGYHPYVLLPDGPDNLVTIIGFYFLDNLYAIMAANGDGNKQIMATEFGWSTYTGSGVDEATQATYIGRVYTKIMYEAYQYVPIACVYDLVNDSSDLTDGESNFGIVHTDYTHKSAYATLQTAAANYKKDFVGGRFSGLMGHS